MTVRERVLTNRLIQKIDSNDSYTRQIGLSYTVSTVEPQKDKKDSSNKREN